MHRQLHQRLSNRSLNQYASKHIDCHNASPESNALDVHEKKGLSSDELLAVIPQYEGLLVRSETKVTASLLQAAKNLKVVARAGVGVDNIGQLLSILQIHDPEKVARIIIRTNICSHPIDVEAATKLGIVVVNSPSGNVGAAAEHTIALMMSMARNIPEGCSILKAGKWERSQFVGIEVKGKTLGIIGLGKVGMIVARSAKGLGMKVTAVDPYASQAVASSASVTLVPSLSDILPVVDFLTIHTPLIASTKGMISTAELAQMKPGSRILNVARGGTIDEVALLAALDSGHLAGAAVDVFTSEPPTEESSAAKLIAHPKVVATPHLGASTIEAQENVSLDVCEQVLQILQGALPRNAVNAPLILPEEYKKLQPFVHLIDKMGSLYTQHYTSAASGPVNRNTFDLIYQGEVANINNTKPLFAALIKGLTAPISSSAGVNVNIVNAELIAKERGIVVNEQHSRDPSSHSYSSLVTLVARPPSATPSECRNHQKQIISGTCSGSQPLITRLDRFETSFIPEGTLIICHNYDSPGKIGVVGSILGRENVNINFMAVAPVSKKLPEGDDILAVSETAGGYSLRPNQDSQSMKEALMILGVDRVVGKNVVDALLQEGGVMSGCVVTL